MLAGVRADSIYCLTPVDSELKSVVLIVGNAPRLLLQSFRIYLCTVPPSSGNPCLIYLLNYCSTTRRFSPKERYPTRQAILALK